MLPLLLNALNRYQPREGWPPLLLLLTALLCTPAALIEANQDVDAVTLLVLTSLATLFGLWLARSRISARGALVLAGALGAALVVVLIGRLLPPPSLIWTEINYASDWLFEWQRGRLSYPLPLSSTAGFLWQRVSALALRLWWWGRALAEGGTAQDPIAMLLLSSGLAWAFGCFAAWHVYRRRSAIIGLLPSGAAITTTVFFTGGFSTFYLMAWLFCALWLAAASHLHAHHDQWQESETDYPGGLGLEMVFALGPAFTLLILLAAVWPIISPREIGSAFWELMDGPWSAVERSSERLFGPIESGGPAGEGPGGDLPRAHLLGTGSELGESVVLYVTTSDPPPPPPDAETPDASTAGFPRRYWRNLTLDTYTGRGWTNALVQRRTFGAGEVLDPTLPPGPELTQRFEQVDRGEDELYAVNAPVWIDQPVSGWWRSPGDLVQLVSTTDRYTVVSRPPQASITEIRRAEPSLPPDTASRYLSLPDTIPQRVLDLAWEVVDQEETGYDQARALETYLRAYTYTLDLPPPPNDVDLVDHFLFSQQEGYCDYYASAMVVMARTVGIPARLAAGYAQGTYDHEGGRWVVTEQDAHSWVEIYFRGIGWIEFEPTAGQPALDRLGGAGQPRPDVPPIPPRALAWWHQIPWELIGIAALAGLALIAIIGIYIWRRRQDLVPTALVVVDRYGRLLEWGRRLGQPLRDGQTPLEYGHALSEALRTQAQSARWSKVRQAGFEAPQEIEFLVTRCIRTQYGSRPVPERTSWSIDRRWNQLRRRLWWLWLDRHL